MEFRSGISVINQVHSAKILKFVMTIQLWKKETKKTDGRDLQNHIAMTEKPVVLKNDFRKAKNPDTIVTGKG
ncbi:hypothetical protein DSECCO2_515650 [anaerobic digester metagenome]